MKQLKNTKALLLVVGIVLLMAACTAAWQRGRNAEQSGQNATNHTHTASKQDSLRLEDVSFGITKDSDNFKREWHIIDTTKQQALLLTPQNVYTTYKYLWKIQGCDSIVWMNTESDYTPSTPKDSVSFFSYYYLYYKGMRIHENPSSLVCQKNNKVFKVSPIMLDQTILSINPVPTINFTQALDSAIIKAFPPNTVFRAQYLRVPTAKSLNEIPSIEQLKKEGKLSIQYIEMLRAYKLVYVFYNMVLKGKSDSWQVLVDAHTGQILGKENNTYYSCETCSQGNYTTPTITENCNANTCSACNNVITLALPTKYYNCQDVVVQANSTNSCINFFDETNKIKLLNHNPNYQPTNVNDPLISGIPISFCKTDLNSPMPISNIDKNVTTALWSMEKIKNFWNAKGVANYSHNNPNKILQIILNYEQPGEASFNDDFSTPNAPSSIVIGPAQTEPSNASDAPVSLDVLAHEYTHGVLRQYYYINHKSTKPESGAIHEAISDIISVLIRLDDDVYQAQLPTGEQNWHVGDITQIGNGIGDPYMPRKLNDPHNQESPQSIYYGSDDLYWNSSSKYNMAGVLSYYFYLLVNGGTGLKGDVVLPLGKEKSEELLIKTLLRIKSAYNPPQVQYIAFNDFLNVSIATAINLGFSCEEIQKVINAFLAVGLVYNGAMPESCPNPIVCATTIPDYENCDNRLPFIGSVQVLSNNSDNIYKARWAWNSANTQLCFTEGVYVNGFGAALSSPNDVISLHGVTIIAESNESLSNLNFVGFESVATNSIIPASDFGITSSLHETSSLLWIFKGNSFPSNFVPGEYRLVFEGTDIAGNQLLNLSAITGLS